MGAGGDTDERAKEGNAAGKRGGGWISGEEIGSGRAGGAIGGVRTGQEERLGFRGRERVDGRDWPSCREPSARVMRGR